MTTQYRRGTGADRHDACHALVALADALTREHPKPSPHRFLCLLGTRAAGIRRGPLALFDLRNGGDDPVPGHGFRREFDDATRGQVRHFVGTARAVTVFGVRMTRWLSIHVRDDAPDSADGRLGDAAIRFATLMLDGDLAVEDAPSWLRANLCIGNERNEVGERSLGGHPG